MNRKHLPDVLRSYAADMGVAGPQYTSMAGVLRQAAEVVDAAVWIAEQPMIGPACSWWDMRAKAREALGLPPVMLSPEEQELHRPPTCVDCED